MLDIYDYIAFTLMEPSIAGKQLRRIRDNIRTLDHMPERHQMYDPEPLRSWEIRMMNVDNYAVFYVIDHERDRVNVVRVLYGKRAFVNLF